MDRIDGFDGRGAKTRATIDPHIVKVAMGAVGGLAYGHGAA